MYCTIDDLKDYLLEKYLAKIEELNPGSRDRQIANVSAEIDEALLQGGFEVPDENTSAMLTRICAVMCDWRLVGEITSLMDTEASSSNEWIPLQRLNSRAEKDLDAIRQGRLDPFPSRSGSNDEVLVSAPDAIFTDDTWRKF
jgi:hypothetical protein